MKNPPLNEYVLGFFKSTIRSVPYHVCDCYFDGTYWKTMGNDRVEDMYCNPPFAWLELPHPPEEEQFETESEVDNRLLRITVYEVLGKPIHDKLTRISDYGWHSWSVVYEDCTISCEEGKVFLSLEPTEREKLVGITRDKLSKRILTLFPSRNGTHETEYEYYDIESAEKKLQEELVRFKKLCRR